MAFQSKTDLLGLADSNLILTDVSENIAASVAEARGSDGSVVANEVYGEKAAPSCTYAVKGDITKNLVLGGVVTIGTAPNQKFYALTDVSVTTSAGTAPKVTAKGQEVPSATASSTYTVANGLDVDKKFSAQILNSAFELSGTGCHVTDCSASYSCSFGDATKDGERLAFDVSDGRIEVQATIVQSGSTVPTISGGANWVVTSPLTKSSPDSDFPTWTVTLTKYLAKDTPAA